MPLQICASHRDQISAALAVRDLNRFNKTNAKDRQAHMISMDKLGQMRVDPFRVAQEIILKECAQARPDLVVRRGLFCPCCEILQVWKDAEGSGCRDEIPADIGLIEDTIRTIDDDLKQKGLK